jgi:chromate transporter
MRSVGAEGEARTPSLAGLASYFLRLGALGFGGPVALADRMRRDLVERRSWISEAEYDTGLAIAAACPGPLAYQLGVYCGYARHGLAGALATAAAFAFVPFVLVTAVAATYERLSASGALRGLFYGVGPVVLALILKACWGLAAKTLRRDMTAWMMAAVAATVTAALERELSMLLVVAGILGAVVFSREEAPAPRHPGPPPARGARAAAGLALPLVAVAGTTASLFWFFFKTGCLVFGSGLVIVPLLKAYVVDEYGWLDERAFVDAVAVGMVSPGPVVIAATFVGFVVGGLSGAAAATVGIFTPAVLFTVAAVPLLQRHGHGRRLRGFVRGITAAVVGVLAGTTPLVGRSVLVDTPTLGLAVAALVALRLLPRAPEPLLVLSGAFLGWLLHPDGAGAPRA